MAISNVNTLSQPSAVKPVAASNPAAAANATRSYEEQQPAAIVTLSARAQKLSREPEPRTQMQTRAIQTEASPQIQTRETQTRASVQADKVTVAKVETSAREAAEAPVTRQQENTERKRINTYA